MRLERKSVENQASADIAIRLDFFPGCPVILQVDPPLLDYLPLEIQWFVWRAWRCAIRAKAVCTILI